MAKPAKEQMLIEKMVNREKFIRKNGQYDKIGQIVNMSKWAIEQMAVRKNGNRVNDYRENS